MGQQNKKPKISHSDKNLLKRSGLATIESVVAQVPPLAPAWYLAKGLLGNALELRQQRALEFVEEIQKNPEIFTQELLEAEAFQDGFASAISDYLKMRGEEKRFVARNIFKGYCKAQDKDSFQLERFNDTVIKISGPSIQHLAFLQSVIIPFRRSYVIEDMKDKNLGVEKPYEWWLDLYISREALSKALSKWVTENYSPNSDKIKAKYGKNGTIPKAKTSELFEAEKKKREELNKPFSELEYLGLISVGMDSGAGWGGQATMVWNLTSFAKEFMQFIDYSPTQR